MINALGNLLPIRPSSPDGISPGGEAPATGTSETDGGAGTFTHALLQFLKPETQAEKAMAQGGDNPGQLLTESSSPEGTQEGMPEGTTVSSSESGGDGRPVLTVRNGVESPLPASLPGGSQTHPAFASTDGTSPLATAEIRPDSRPGSRDGTPGLEGGTEPGVSPRAIPIEGTGFDMPRGRVPDGFGRPSDTPVPATPTDPTLRGTVQGRPGATNGIQINHGASPEVKSPGAPIPVSPEVASRRPEAMGTIPPTNGDSAEVTAPRAVQGQAASPNSPTDGPSETFGASEIGSADAHPVDRDPARLEPEFRGRLDRVIYRMEKEFGHNVVMVEGYRSPDRQSAVYAQGRTQPGPVVTWTQDSLHSQGRAADLQVDGSWNNPLGYARLQHVAKEEGLRVLGGKDPGHVELPEGGGTTRSQSPWGRPSTGPRVARPASVARPATAQVASTARVAMPAAVGSGPGTQVPTTGSTVPASGPTVDAPSVEALASETSRPGPNRPIPEVSTPPLPASVLKGSTSASRSPGVQASAVEDATLQDRRIYPGPAESATTEATTSATTQRSPVGPEALQGGAGEVRATPQPAAAQPASGIDRVGPAQRVNEILTMGETWDTQALGRLHLQMDDVDGAGTRIRLAMRGSELSGSLDLTDPVLAGRMRERIGELHQALSRQGIEAQGLEARALTGVEGRSASDGDLASLLKDPLAGMARILEAKDSSSQSRGDDQRNTRQEWNRSDDRLRENPKRDQSKENRQ